MEQPRPATETLFLCLFAVFCIGMPVAGLLAATWWTHDAQLEMAGNANRLGASQLLSALRDQAPDAADEVRALARRHGDVESFEAGDGRATFTVDFVSHYVTTRETDGWKHDCFEYVWLYADPDGSSYTEVECGP